MARERHYDITLHLDNLTEFFAAPEPDPYDPRTRFASGLETIVSELKPKALIRKVRTTIVLPPDQITPDAAPAGSPGTPLPIPYPAESARSDLSALAGNQGHAEWHHLSRSVFAALHAV